MALTQLPQANALVIDLGMHTVRMGFAHDPSPICVIQVSSLSKDGTDISATDLSYAIYTEFESKLQPYIAEPIPVLVAINHDIRPSFVFHLLDHLLSIFPGVAFHSAISCAAYASTHTTALIVDCGHTATRVALVADGVIASIQVVPEFSGEKMLTALQQAIKQRHTLLCDASEIPCNKFSQISSSELLPIAQRLLVHRSAVSLNIAIDRELARTTFTYEEVVDLPCEHKVTLNEELFTTAEDLLMQSKLSTVIASTLASLPSTLQSSKVKVPVVFVGGLARLTNLIRRMQLDLPAGTIVQSSDDSINIVWQGGASFVGIETLADFLITRTLLDEQGAGILSKMII